MVKSLQAALAAAIVATAVTPTYAQGTQGNRASHPAFHYDGVMSYDNGYPPGGARRGDGTMQYLAGSTTLVIGCRPGRFCQIEVPQGETIVSKALYDAVRWEAPDTAYGTQLSRRIVVIKERSDDPTLSTQLVILTNGAAGRYTVTIKAMKDAPRNGTQIAFVSRRPAPSGSPRGPATSAAAIAQSAPAVQGATGDQPCVKREPATYGGWDSHSDYAPTAVYEDSIHTCIVMPNNVRQLPIVLAYGVEGPEIVNYRFNSGVFVVDGVRDHLILQLGTTGKKSHLDIYREPERTARH
jgi:type IV secretory pathway VirB9-like protein